MKKTMKNTWMTNYELAKKYYEANGNLAVPANYKTKGGINLGAWISKQRQAYKNSKLSNEQVSLLDSAGMVWEKNYEVAKEYYEANGNLAIPEEKGKMNNLFEWIHEQRVQFQA